ncbi:MAG TPA: hypothetical protein VF026_14245 [Ktedonobacteraceae bacterium]
MKTSRPLVLTLAVIFLVLISLGSLATPLLSDPPIPVQVLSVVLGLLCLLAAYGLWNRKRWGMIVAIVVSAINALSGVPGLLVQPNLPATLAAGVGIVISVLIIVLTVLPSARAAYA